MTEAVGRFLDRELLGKRPSVDDPAVVVQEAPSLRWRTEAAWPPRDVKPVEMPVRSGTYLDTSGNGSGDTYSGPPAPRVPPPPTEQLPTGRGSWTFTERLPHSAHLAGAPRLRVEARGPADARLVALLYDVALDGKAFLITRGATLLRSGDVDVELYPQDWRLAHGHRLGLLLSGADDSWWIAHSGTGAEVSVQSGELSLPALSCVRDEFVEGARSEYWERFKHPIAVDQATISQRTVGGGVPPEPARGAVCEALVRGA